MQIFEGLKKGMAPNLDHDSPVDFLMVVGDGRDDEVIFRWANELGVDKTVKYVTTVSLGSRNTEAGCTLTQGVTGKLPTWTYRAITNSHRGLDGPSEAGYAFLKTSLSFGNSGYSQIVFRMNIACRFRNIRFEIF
jgi:hypothetical protein